MPRPARPWFRFYVEAVYDRKLRRLSPEHRWLFVACLAIARQSQEPGRLMIGADQAHASDLADVAALPSRTVVAGMDALCEAGVVALDGEGWFLPRWSERQFESDDVTKRTAKHRNGNGVAPTLERSNVVPGNGPDTETDTDTEREGARSASPRGSRIPIPYIVAPADQEWAEREHPRVDWDTETKKFVDHFRAKTGKDATKLDWSATWKNWIRRAEEWR